MSVLVGGHLLGKMLIFDGVLNFEVSLVLRTVARGTVVK